MLGKNHWTSTWADVWFLFFYHFCRPLHFLNLLETDAVFSMNNNNVSHLSSACVPSTELSTLPASFYFFQLLGFCVIFFSLMFQHCLLVYKKIHYYNSLWFQPLWNCLYVMGITSSILQMRKLDLRWAQPAESREDSNLAPSTCCFCCLTHRPRPLPRREGGRCF